MSSINLDLVCYEHSDFPLNVKTEGLTLYKRVELFERFSLVKASKNLIRFVRLSLMLAF